MVVDAEACRFKDNLKNNLYVAEVGLAANIVGCSMHRSVTKHGI